MMMSSELLSDHCRIWCGDALHVLPHLTSVDAVIADPPYSSGGLFRGDRMAHTGAKYIQSDSRDIYRDFTGDNRDQRSFAYWSTLWMSLARRAAVPGALLVVFCDWRQIAVTTDAVQAAGWIWRGIVVWDKTEGARPQLGRYRNQTEFAIWGTNGPRPLKGRTAPGVFRYPVRSDEKVHQAGKPVALMADLLGVLDPHALVLDPFMGSASTGVAALRRGLRFEGIEIDPHWFSLSRDRLRGELGSMPLFQSEEVGTLFGAAHEL